MLLFFSFFALLFCIQDGGPDLFVSVKKTTATSGVALKLRCSSPGLSLPERALCASQIVDKRGLEPRDMVDSLHE